MRIDAHGHGMHAEHLPDGSCVPPLRHGWTPGAQTPEQHVAESRRQGVDRVVLLDPPHVVFPLKETFGDYVIPVCMVDADKITPAEIDALLSRGAAGIKFIHPMHSYGDNHYFPLYEVIRDHRKLAVFHTGYVTDKLLKPGALLGRDDYVDITDMRPAALDRVARAFRDMNILMAHFGNPWWEEAWNVLHNFKNVYADFSGGTAWKRPMEMWKQIFTHAGRPDMDSIRKLCYASDVSFCFQGLYQFQPFIAFYDRFFDMMSVPPDIRELVNHANIERLTSSAA